MAEAITVNRAFAIAMGVIGTLGAAAIFAGVQAVLSTREAIVEVKTTIVTQEKARDAERLAQEKQRDAERATEKDQREAMGRRMDDMARSIDALGSNRYTASDAASDRVAFFKALDTAYTTTANRIDALQRAKDEQGVVIADLRVQIARMESKHP